jgi:hypothetical protein
MLLDAPIFTTQGLRGVIVDFARDDPLQTSRSKQFTLLLDTENIKAFITL